MHHPFFLCLVGGLFFFGFFGGEGRKGGELLLAKEQSLPPLVQDVVPKQQEKYPSELQQQAFCDIEIITGHNRASGHNGMDQDHSQQAIRMSSP